MKDELGHALPELALAKYLPDHGRDFLAHALLGRRRVRLLHVEVLRIHFWYLVRISILVLASGFVTTLAAFLLRAATLSPIEIAEPEEIFPGTRITTSTVLRILHAVPGFSGVTTAGIVLGAAIAVLVWYVVSFILRLSRIRALRRNIRVIDDEIVQLEQALAALA